MKQIIDKTIKYYSDARQRATRRKSPWNIVLILLLLVTWPVIWYMLLKLIWLFHVTIYPSHEWGYFWHQSGSISLRSLILGFLMAFSIVPGAMTLACILVNVLFWFIPWFRRIFESEAKGYSGTSFRTTMHKLFKIFLWTFPAGLAISLLAAYFLQSLR